VLSLLLGEWYTLLSTLIKKHIEPIRDCSNNPIRYIDPTGHTQWDIDHLSAADYAKLEDIWAKYAVAKTAEERTKLHLEAEAIREPYRQGTNFVGSADGHTYVAKETSTGTQFELYDKDVKHLENKTKTSEAAGLPLDVHDPRKSSNTIYTEQYVKPTNDIVPTHGTGSSNNSDNIVVEVLIHSQYSPSSWYGHADIAIGDKVYAYGRYDDSAVWGIGGIYGEGVLKVLDKMTHIEKEKKKVDGKDIWGYVLKVSPEEAKKIEEYFINQIKDNGSIWYRDTETGAIYYKFDKGSKYYEYKFIGGPNCSTFVVDALEYGLGNRLNITTKYAISPGMLNCGLGLDLYGKGELVESYNLYLGRSKDIYEFYDYTLRLW